MAMDFDGVGVSVFSSLFMWGGTSPVGSDLEWKSQRKNHFKKMGFPFAGGHFPRRKFIWSDVLLFSFLVSFIDRELFCFPPILSFYFLLIFDQASFFSFSFHFFLFISFFFDLWLGIRVLAFVIRSPFEEILLSSSSRERMRILFMGQGLQALHGATSCGIKSIFI